LHGILATQEQRLRGVVAHVEFESKV